MGIVQKWPFARHCHSLTWRSRVDPRPGQNGNHHRPNHQHRLLDSQPLRRRVFWSLFVARTKSDPPRRAEPSGSTATTCHQQREPSSIGRMAFWPWRQFRDSLARQSLRALPSNFFHSARQHSHRSCVRSGFRKCRRERLHRSPRIHLHLCTTMYAQHIQIHGNTRPHPSPLLQIQNRQPPTHPPSHPLLESLSPTQAARTASAYLRRYCSVKCKESDE